MKPMMFFVVFAGLVAANFLYQACCIVPNWAAATERSWFQMVALGALGASWAIASINH